MFKNAKNVIETRSSIEGLYTIASVGEQKSFVLVSNYSGKSDYYELELQNLNTKETTASVSYVNKEFNLTPYKTEFYHGDSVKQTIYLEKNSVALIEIECK
jgi:hypothetical protein